MQTIINKRKEAKRTICNYVDFLMSTNDPRNPDDGNWVKPTIHPCKRDFKEIPKEELDRDYIDLLNLAQRHTHCSTAYCLRHKQ